MELALYTKPGELSEAAAKGSHVVVVDVLRASSTVVHAYENGAEWIIPVAQVEDATRLVQTLDRKNTLRGGERDGRMIEGFDLGNSPPEYTSKAVRGKTLILCTSNGTVAITACAAAGQIIVGCLMNLSAVVAHLMAERPRRAAIVCAGDQGQLSLEDFVCGGLMVARLEQSSRARLVMNDGAVAAKVLSASMPDVGDLVRKSSHGRRLAELGFEKDLDVCSKIDRYGTVPVVVEGRISGKGLSRR